MATPVVTQTKALRKATIPTIYADVDQFEFTANAGTATQKHYIYFNSVAANTAAAGMTA